LWDCQLCKGFFNQRNSPNFGLLFSPVKVMYYWCLQRTGANPTTFEFTATTPALHLVGYSVYESRIKYFLFSIRARLPVAL
jgi:hypothetical protein